MRVPMNAADLAEFHLQYNMRLTQTFIGLIREADKAEDIAAMLFEAAWEERATFRGDSSPYTWISAIGRHKALWPDCSSKLLTSSE
jgi:DNA-directed RNA polymerase specialized sigma24 family protein